MDSRHLAESAALENVLHLVYLHILFRNSGFGIRDSGFGIRVLGFGFRVSGFEVRVSPRPSPYPVLGSMLPTLGTILGFGFRVLESRFRVSGFEIRVLVISSISVSCCGNHTSEFR